MAFRAAKVVATLPGTLAASTLYLVRVGAGFDLYVSDSTGSVAHALNLPTGGASVYVGDTEPDSATYKIWVTSTGAIFVWDGEVWFQAGGTGGSSSGSSSGSPLASWVY